MSKLEHVLFIVLIIVSGGSVMTNYLVDQTHTALWALMSTLWTFNYYMLKRKQS